MRFAVCALAREPTVEVYSGGVWLANVGGTFLHETIWQTKLLYQVFLNSDVQFVLSRARLWRREALHFELVELVQAEDTFHVLAVATGFAAEARAVAEITDWEHIFGQNLVPV